MKNLGILVQAPSLHNTKASKEIQYYLELQEKRAIVRRQKSCTVDNNGMKTSDRGVDMMTSR